MHRAAALPILFALLLAGTPATAQPAEEDRKQEAIIPEGTPATSAITKTDDLPVIGDELGEEGIGESDINVVGESPAEADDRTEVPTAPGGSVDGGMLAEPEPSRMFPGRLAPATEGAIGRGRIYAEELKDYTVHLADVEGFGKVERLIINLETGRVDDLVVAAGGGLLGIGETRFEIPFAQVAAINTGSKELRVSISRDQIELPGDTGESELRD